jgi:hypothetical protein
LSPILSSSCLRLLLHPRLPSVFPSLSETVLVYLIPKRLLLTGRCDPEYSLSEVLSNSCLSLVLRPPVFPVGCCVSSVYSPFHSVFSREVDL